MPPSPPYFTTTLSESLTFNTVHRAIKTRLAPYGVVQCHTSFVTVPEFIDFLAREYSERLAVGCASPGGGDTEFLNFADVKGVSARTATWLRQRLPAPSDQGTTIALLASSSLVFVSVWLALIRAGYQVLLVAPQNTSSTVRHLLSTSHAVAICCDERYSSLAASASEEASVPQVKIPWTSLSELDQDTSHLESTEPREVSGADPALATAYYFHSTGTTGAPKLIPQTHHGAVGVLPLLQDTWSNDEKVAGTFTTTPLYHGGIADLFRSWSAGAALWIFPEHAARITGSTVVECIEAIDRFPERKNTYLANLSCVPFVLEMILQDPAALKRFKRLDRVGVGGAAMSKCLGDQLVSEGVNLVSRFGSSECGFLLSSERDYTFDKEWDVLRKAEGPELFQAQDGGLHELVVPQKWPVVSTAEHAARPFRTKDLFKYCTTGWKYVGRADSQLTLATGKKFDPQGIESALKQAESIEEVIVVGEGKMQPGLLVFVSQTLSKVGVEKQRAVIQKVVEDINTRSPPHARVKKSMIKILPFTQAQHLKKNAKGAIIKNHALRTFKADLDALYAPSTRKLDASSDRQTIRNAVASIVTGQLPIYDDVSDMKSLFEYGLDSSGCMQIRSQLQQIFSSTKTFYDIPLSKIYELDTLHKLAAWTDGMLKRGDENEQESTEELYEQKLRQVNEMTDQFGTSKYGHRPDDGHQRAADIPNSPSSEKVVLLTGATGFLGAHILAQLLEDHKVVKIYLLVRETRIHTAREHQQSAKSRIDNSLLQRGLPSLAKDRRVVVYPSDFADSNLGLTNEQYQELSGKTTHLIHAAWEVNFNLPLQAFQPQLQALVHLYDLLENAGPTAPTKRIVFCSSTAVSTDLEKPDASDAKAVPATGYGQSKWVAEKVLQRKATLDTAILRIGQLCGDTINGIWNRQEAWPLMIDAGSHAVPQIYAGGSSETSGAVLPDLAGAGQPDIDWLPVDTAARRVLAYSFEAQTERVRKELVANTSTSVSWARFQDLVRQNAELESGKKVRFIAPTAWLDLLEKTEQHRAQSLISLWRENWCSGPDSSEELQNGSREDHAGDSSGEGDVSSLSEEAIWKMVNWIVGQ